MTPRERLNRLVQGHTVPDPPLFHPILMHFAARFGGGTYRGFASDHRVLVESTMACVERFGLDAVMLVSDPWRETSAFGAEVEFPEDAVPICRTHLVGSMKDVEALPDPDVHACERTRDRILGAEYYRKLVGGSIPIIGWVEGPLAEACDLGGVNEILLALGMEEEYVPRLMEKCIVTAKAFARAQIEAGCSVMGVGDAICSQISPTMYGELVLPLHRELFSYIHSLGALVKLHICGNITHLLPLIGAAGADIVDIDWMVDPSRAHEALGEKTIVCGNLDPVSVVRNLTAPEVHTAARALIESEHGKPFILSGGCEIIVDTPHENLLAMREAAG